MRGMHEPPVHDKFDRFVVVLGQLFAVNVVVDPRKKAGRRKALDVVAHVVFGPGSVGKETVVESQK